jgi:hypothetical protein
MVLLRRWLWSALLLGSLGCIDFLPPFRGEMGAGGQGGERGGAGGASGCTSCDARSDRCVSGDCRCGEGAPCLSGQACTSGTCACTAASCPDGCCANGRCIRPASQNEAVCGLGGGECGTCYQPGLAVCNSTGNTSRVPRSPGNCIAGGCQFDAIDVPCAAGCDGGYCNGDNCRGCVQPPAPTCVGSVARRAITPGLCNQNQCEYAFSEATCAFGCSRGACLPDPCVGVSCATPPPPKCTADGMGVVERLLPGTCADGGCAFSLRTTNCNEPPAPACSSATSRTVFVSAGCDGGRCAYAPTEETCSSGCVQGVCQGDRCTGVMCNQPPTNTCFDATSRRVFNGTGTCADGGCSYGSQRVFCDAPPAATCLSDGSLRSFAATGTCSNGTCTYAASESTCPFGCNSGACRPNPCLSVSCTMPPASDCADVSTRRVFASPGTCDGGVCGYGIQLQTCNQPPGPYCQGDTAIRPLPNGTCSAGACTYPTSSSLCPQGCLGGSCLGDPCQGVACSSPPAAVCFDSSTRTVFSSPGTCSGGTCSYRSVNAPCNAPPAAVCFDAATAFRYGPVGRCDGGFCLYEGRKEECPPRVPVCDPNGAARIVYAPTCTGAGVCGHSQSQELCAFGCSNGVCRPDPCTGVSCTTPPSPICIGSTMRRAFTSPGSCSGGTCSYQPTDSTCVAAAPTCVGSLFQPMIRQETPFCDGGACGVTVSMVACLGTCDAGVCYGCNGCIDDPTGMCRSGTEETACGINGGLCVNCTDVCNRSGMNRLCIGGACNCP